MLVKVVNQLNLTKMKTILFALTIGFISITVDNTSLHAQRSVQNGVSPDRKNFMPSIRKFAAMEDSAAAGIYISNLNYVSIWAIRDFLDRYSNVDNAKWFLTPDGGFESYFVQDGYGDRIFYDKKGYWLYSLITYGENKLPRDIRYVVRSTYFDFMIVIVEELQMAGGIEYIISLEDKTNIKVVKVNGAGDMEVLQDLDK